VASTGPQRTRAERGKSMNNNSRHALRGLRWSYCAFIAAASISAAESALHGHKEGSQMILGLAVTETIAALAFAIEPVEVIACGVLILVYCVAGVVSAVSCDWVAILRFVFYAATAIYIVLASRVNKRVAPVVS
jgi:hypothetical protein